MSYTNDGPVSLRPVPERPDDLWRWTASETAHGIRTGHISATEATRAVLARIETVNPTLNALVEVYPDEALAAAAAADQAVHDGAALGALHGVPAAIKVNTAERGHATTDGIASMRDNIAADDAPVTANLRKAGAVFVGRSNTPAFSFRWFCDNDAHGRTLNPWNAQRTPGGSSGGAASAAASGMVGVAHGNDIGGSIRYPAYACGVTGIRPTVGRVPTYGGVPNRDPSLSSQLMAVHGPLGRCVSDLRLILDAMRGPDQRDPYQVPAPTRGPEPQRPIRVALVRDVGLGEPAPAVSAALDAAAGWLTEAGYRVEEMTLPVLADAWRLWLLLGFEDFRPTLPLVDELGDDNIRRAARLYYQVTAEVHGAAPSQLDYMRGWGRRAALAHSLREQLAATPLVLTPVSAEPPFPYGDDVADVDRTRALLRAQWPMFAVPALDFPAIALPTGVVDGLPTGVQILGDRFREDLLLDAGEVIEARAGTFAPIDPR